MCCPVCFFVDICNTMRLIFWFPEHLVLLNVNELTEMHVLQEYDNDAETLVSSLSHNYDDDELELGE